MATKASQDDQGKMKRRQREVEMFRHGVVSGITFGSALAITISWSLNKSVLWAIIHGIFSWLYVIYYLIMR
jgi:hypothetical protein